MKGIKLNASTVKSMATAAWKWAGKNAPAILAGVGIAGMIGAVVSAIPAGRDLHDALEEAELKKNNEKIDKAVSEGKEIPPLEPLTVKEKLPIFVKYLWKPTVLGAISGGAMFASVHAGNKKIKLYEVMAATASTELIDFKEAAKKVVGEKNYDKIASQVLDDDLAKNPPSDEIIHNTGRGNTLMYEPWFRTYFWGDIENVRSLAGDIATKCVKDREIYMRDIYIALGIDTNADLEELIKDMNKGTYHSLLDMYGYFCDPDEGIYHTPELKKPAPVKSVVLNGKEMPCYVVDFGKPISIDDLERDSFRRGR